MINVTRQLPQYGVNYGPGWIGFIARRDSFVAEGIDWFERWDNISHVPVSHTFNISGSDLTVEAFENGVEDGSLENYLLDPDVALLVRKPVLMNPTLAAAIVNVATSHLGEPYNNRLIAAMAASNTYLGHGLNWVTGDRSERMLCWLADSARKWVCSKLVKTTLQQPAYTPLRGVMQMPAYMVKPIDLFEDLFVFEPGAIELIPDQS